MSEAMVGEADDYGQRYILDFECLNVLSVVALTEDLSAKGLLRDQVGTIVERLCPGRLRSRIQRRCRADQRYGARHKTQK